MILDLLYKMKKKLFYLNRNEILKNLLVLNFSIDLIKECLKNIIKIFKMNLKFRRSVKDML